MSTTPERATGRSRRRPAWLAALVALTLVAATCADDSADDAGGVETDDPTTTAATSDDTGDDTAADGEDEGEEAEEPEEDVELTASSRGVTETEISMGIVAIDFEQVLQFGVDVTPIPTADLYTAWSAAQNDRGGINGRDLVTHTELYLPIGTEVDEMCVALGEDIEVFAVLGQMIDNQMTCFWQDYDIPYVGIFGWRESFRDTADGRMIAGEMSNLEQRTGGVSAMIEDGEFEDRNVAILWGAPADADFADAVRPLLEAAGVNVVSEAEIGDFGQDQQAAQDAEDVIMLRFQSEEVDFILSLSNILAPVEMVERAGEAGAIRIGYTNGQVADSFLIGDAVASEEALANTFAVTTHKPGPDELADLAGLQQCIDEYEAMFPDDPIDVDDLEAVRLILSHCNTFRLMVLSLEAAGPNPTPETWVEGTYELGTFDLPGIIDARIDEEKRDAGSFLARYEWDSEAGYHVIVGEPFLPAD